MIASMESLFLLAAWAAMAWGAAVTEGRYRPSNVPVLAVLALAAYLLQSRIFGKKYLEGREALFESAESRETLYYAGSEIETGTETHRENRKLDEVLDPKRQVARQIGMAALVLAIVASDLLGIFTVYLTTALHILAILSIVPAMSLGHALIPVAVASAAVLVECLGSSPPQGWMLAAFVFLSVLAFAAHRAFAMERFEGKARAPEAGLTAKRVSLDAALQAAVFVTILAVVDFLVPNASPPEPPRSASRSTEPKLESHTMGRSSTGGKSGTPRGGGGGPRRALPLALPSFAMPTWRPSPGASPFPIDWSLLARLLPQGRPGEPLVLPSVWPSALPSNLPLEELAKAFPSGFPSALPSLIPAELPSPPPQLAEGSGGDNGDAAGGPDETGAEPPPPPKPPWLTPRMLKMLVALASLLGVALFYQRLFRREDPVTRKRRRLVRESRAELALELQRIAERRLAPREEIIRQYELFTRIMATAGSPREPWLPETDFQRRLRLVYPQLAEPCAVITDIFCETLFAARPAGQERVQAMRQAVTRILSSF